jgi:antitoxin (DNA-binding transcriptional repressor) of toxin-antitoxin stability system
MDLAGLRFPFLVPEIHELPNALARVYNLTMGKHVIHISEEEAAVTNVATLLAHVRAGSEVIIENGVRPVAVLHPAEPVPRTISECIALLPEDSTATVDPDFARDVAAAVEAHREPLNPPTWD